MAKGVVPSRKIQIEEIIKCGKDPIYFINHYVYIQHPDRGLIKFDTYEFQDDCVKQFLDNRLNIVLKSRQLGLSTIVAAYCLWLAIFYKDKNVLVIATKMAVAKNFIQKVRTMYKSLPSWLVLPTLEQDSTQALSFNNGSIVKAAPTNQDVGRSEALSLLVVDEAAHIEKLDELWLGLWSTVSTGGRCIVLSTPKGVGNQFHKLWDDAEKGKNSFNTIKLPWTVHPEHDQDWFEEQAKTLGPKGTAQELLCDFQASGQAYLTNEDIKWMGEMIAPPIDRGGPDMNMWIWKYPVADRKYIVSADVCRGDGDDFAAFHVIDMMEDEVVADYRGKMPPDRFAEFLVFVGEKYNNALVCNEKNSFGVACSYKLRDLGYKNLYFEKYMANPFGIQYIPEGDEEICGLTTTGKNRTPMLAKLEEIIRNKKMKVYSSRLYEEAKTFVVSGGGKIQAMRGYNDDLIMALAIGCWTYDVAAGYNKHSEGLGQAMLAGMTKSSTVFNGSGWAGFNNGGGYMMPIMPMSFERRNSTDPINQRKMPMGVDRTVVERNAMLYGMFGWVLESGVDKKG
jgi:hypothetical protein